MVFGKEKTSFFGIKGAFFLKTTRRICAKFFFRV